MDRQVVRMHLMWFLYVKPHHNYKYLAHPPNKHIKRNSKECKTLSLKSAKYSGHPPKLSATRRCDINAYTVGGVNQ